MQKAKESHSFVVNMLRANRIRNNVMNFTRDFFGLEKIAGAILTLSIAPRGAFVELLQQY